MSEPVMMETIGDVFSHAADVIEQRGWTQGNLTDLGTGSVCTLGAINVVLTGAPGVRNYALEQPRRTLRIFLSVPSIASWNDSVAGTKEEVIRTLRLAAWVYDDQLLPQEVPFRG